MAKYICGIVRAFEELLQPALLHCSKYKTDSLSQGFLSGDVAAVRFLTRKQPSCVKFIKAVFASFFLQETNGKKHFWNQEYL